jgi:hypothetical protein
VVGVGLAVLLLGPADLLVMALVAPALVLIAHVGIVPATRGGLDVSQVAPLIRRWQAAGPVGHVGTYHGQFHFYGRLVQPLEIVPAGAERDWLARHPAGRLIAYRRRSRPVPAGVEHAQPYRNRTLVVLGQAALEAGLR